MTGAVPSTNWLAGCLALDGKEFIRTGANLRPEDLSPKCWFNGREPLGMEASIPRVFAIGDVRYGSVKRVAAAVGEGAACVSQVHRVLQERELSEYTKPRFVAL